MEERQDSGSKAKGKQKQEDSANTTEAAARDDKADGASTPASVFSRIARSATGLGRDLVSGSISDSNWAPGTSSSTQGKAGSSRPSVPALSPETVEQSAVYQHRPATGAAASGLGHSSYSHVQGHVAAQEDAFSRFLDGTDINMDLPSEPLDLSLATMTTRPEKAPLDEMSALSAESISAAVAAQERRDGQDVVLLLMGNEEATAAAEEEERMLNYGPIVDDEDGVNLPDVEREALRRALFPESSSSNTFSSATAWDNVLNFIPDFVRPNADGYGETIHGAVPTSKSRETQAAMGLDPSPETTRQWLDQWQDVLTRYTDEVWGGLAPLVSQARQELDELQNSAPGDPAANAKALARLQQLLGHLRGS